MEKTLIEEGELSFAPPGGQMVIPLGRLAEKYSMASLAGFIAHPLRVRPSGRMPAAYLLEGSNDGKAFALVDRRDIPPFKDRFQTQTFLFPNEQEWAIYRLTITKVRSGNNADAMQFAEMQFFTSKRSRPGVANRFAAKPLDAIDIASATGCLSEGVASKRPRFSLSKQQREALVKTVGELQRKPEPLDAKSVTDLTMKTLRCYACHERNGKGGPPSELSGYFTYEKLVDLGDEGRLPPPLDIVGAKLTAEGFKDVFAGDRYRSYMSVRMPQFGQQNMTRLAKQFAEADADKVPKHTPAKVTGKLINDGRALVGKGRLVCVNCHIWGDASLPGAEGMDLMRVTRRIQPAWFHAWLTDPQKMKRGTRMPNAWPRGKSLYKDILKGDATLQKDAIWAYLSAGERGGLPKGLSPADTTRLVLTDSPVVFRTFVNGVSAHAILVR